MHNFFLFSCYVSRGHSAGRLLEVQGAGGWMEAGQPAPLGVSHHLTLVPSQAGLGAIKGFTSYRHNVMTSWCHDGRHEGPHEGPHDTRFLFLCSSRFFISLPIKRLG